MMAVLSRPATAKRHANALQHAAGFLKDSIGSDDRQELAEIIDDYGRGLVPLIVPITLLRHHVRKVDAPEWLASQVYLDPYPGELMIRNQV